MQVRAGKGSRIFAFLLSLIMAVTMTTSLSLLAEPSYAAATETVAVKLVDKAGNDQTLATWTYDAEKVTYNEADGTEVGIVQTFNEPLVYTGINRKPDPRCLSVTTKGILLEDFYDYAEDLAGMDLRGDTKLCMDANGFSDTFTYDQYWGLDRYSYLDWYNADEYSETEMGESEVEVPATLAINGYHNAITDGRTTVEELVGKADSAYALRISVGMQKNGNRTITPVSGTSTDKSNVSNYGDVNEGFLSVKNIDALQFTPNYLPINIENGTAAGEAGTDLVYNVEHATVATDDHYFTAAAGEAVTFTVTPDAGYLATVTATAGEESIELENTGNEYSFAMTDEAVTIKVAAEKDMSPISVSTADELAAVAEIVNGGNDLAGRTVTLEKDIDLSGIAEWTPIGTAANPFAGTFDGNGKTISGLTITTAAGGYKGLIGNNKGTVKDFTIEGTIGTADAYITAGADNIGGAVGYNDGTVSGIIGNVPVFIKASIYAAGGIVGQNGDEAIVTECWNKADVNASKASGGVVGRNFGEITKCKNSGNITGNQGGKDGIGGIAGYGGNKNSTYQNSITSCYNTGTITNNGGRWHGGIAGFADSATTVTNCYDVGQITKGYSWNWNPVIGHVDSAYTTVHDNYSLEGLNAGDTTANTKPLTIGTIKTDAEMKSPAFAELLGDDFQAQCGYPALAWETPKAHVEGEPQDTETVAATFDEGDYHYSVTACTECGLELSRSDKIYTSESLSKQAEDAIAAAQDAQNTADELAEAAAKATGEDAVEAAQKALEAATAAQEAALAAQEAAQAAYAAASEEQQTAAQGLVDTANNAVSTADQAVADTSELADEALAESNSIKELKDTATVSMATLNSTVEEDLYTPATYEAYAGAIEAFNEIVKSGSATRQDVIDARAAITKAYASLVRKTSIAAAEVTGLKTVSYTGKAFKPAPVVTLDGTKLTAGTDYTVSYSNNTNAGKATVTVTGEGDYMDSAKATFTISKIAQKMTATPKTKTVSVKKVKKAKQTVTGAITVKNAKGKVTYSKKSGSAKLTISSAGKITVKKATKKGTYKIRVNVKAAATKNYKALTKTVTVSVKVK